MECMRIMAASRRLAARVLTKEGVSHIRCRTPQTSCLRTLSIPISKHHDYVMATASDPFIRCRPTSFCSSLRTFSVASIPSEASSPGKGKKSPHSKLLRVCSERNSNPHFAAIEAELLRFDWKEAIDALVEDWSEKRRWGDFIELECNIRSYVNKNLTDLKFEHNKIVDEWQYRGILKGSVSLSEHMFRAHFFPHEAIISSAVRHALTGENILSQYKMEQLEGNANKIAISELSERISLLSTAGELLNAMASFDVDGDQSPEEDTNKNVWSVHHTSCSKCYQSVVAGWFLLHRRLREANQKMISESNAAEIIEATIKLDIHPEHEAFVWTEKWIDFCTASHVAEGEEEEGEGVANKVLLGGISASDKPLVIGVAKMLSMSNNEKHQNQAAQLHDMINMLFPDDE